MQNTPTAPKGPTQEQLHAWELFVKFGWADTSALVATLLRMEEGVTYAPPAPTLTEMIVGGDDSWMHDGRNPIARNRAALRELFGAQVLELAITESPEVIAAFGDLLRWQREQVRAAMPPRALDVATDRQRGGLLGIFTNPKRERAARLKEAVDDVRVAAELIAQGASHREAYLAVEAHRMLEGLFNDMASDLSQWAAYYAPLRSEVSRARALTATQQETTIQATIARLPSMSDLDAPEYWYPLLLADAIHEESAAARLRVRRALDTLLAQHAVEEITAEMIIAAIRADVGTRSISLPSLHAAFAKLNPERPIAAMDEWAKRLMAILETRPAPRLRPPRFTDQWESLFYVAQHANAQPVTVENVPSRTVQFRDGSTNNTRLLLAEVTTNFVLDDLVRYKELVTAGATEYSRVLPPRMLPVPKDTPVAEHEQTRLVVRPLEAQVHRDALAVEVATVASA